MWYISSFYRFAHIAEENVEKLKVEFERMLSASQSEGLLIFSCEGANGTISSPTKDGADEFVSAINRIDGFDPVIWKMSECEKKPFKRLSVVARKEIVTLKRPDFFPDKKNNHLTPRQWHEALLSKDENIVVLDTRNDYETKVGVFKGAIDPKIKIFSQFGDFLDKAKIPTDKKVLMYCTGGVRCEKAIMEMQERGYENVYQLEGGILKYFEEYPQGEYEGECFVFDHRVAVDPYLQPSQKYALCKLCGDPSEQKITCSMCGTEGDVCDSCIEKGKIACSKNCAHHVELRKNESKAA